jgi:hypothetical protein
MPLLNTYVVYSHADLFSHGLWLWSTFEFLHVPTLIYPAQVSCDSFYSFIVDKDINIYFVPCFSLTLNFFTI